MYAYICMYMYIYICRLGFHCIELVPSCPRPLVLRFARLNVSRHELPD